MRGLTADERDLMAVVAGCACDPSGPRDGHRFSAREHSTVTRLHERGLVAAVPCRYVRLIVHAKVTPLGRTALLADAAARNSLVLA